MMIDFRILFMDVISFGKCRDVNKMLFLSYNICIGFQIKV